MSPLPQTDRIQVAVITGGHAFDVPGLSALFHSLDAIDWYPQSLENFVADVGDVRSAYHVVLFYHMPGETPAADGAIARVLQEMPLTAQGILVLHHGILAHRYWGFWSDLVGIPDRRFGYDHDRHLTVQVADPTHPITVGLSDWEMVDETYDMADPGADSHVLLRVDLARSMSAVAWVRQVQMARVFCYQSGHDRQAYEDPNFRTVLERGIAWCAGRI